MAGLILISILVGFVAAIASLIAGAGFWYALLVYSGTGAAALFGVVGMQLSRHTKTVPLRRLENSANLGFAGRSDAE